MKKDRRTQTAMQDRYKWLKGLAKLRSYNFNGRENDYLFILYSTMRSICSPELSKVLLSQCNGGLAYPRSDDAIEKIIRHTEIQDRPYSFRNEDIISKLKITEQEIEALQIGHNQKVIVERKQRADQKKSVQTWVKAYYGMGYTTAEIAKALPSASKRTIQRYLAKVRKEQALEDAEETASIAAKIIDMYRNNVDIVQIARQTKSTIDDVRRILGLGGMTDFTIQESISTNRELQGFKSTDCLELFSLTSYNEERTLTGLDEHTTAMATLQTFKGNICIIGAGGTGKTFLINRFLESLSPEEKDSTLIVCPTGKAADHLNGITIHKAFHLSNDVQLPDAITTVPKDLLSVTRIIIDEVNMVRIDIFDKIMRMVQFIKETTNHTIQVIVMGDWGQIQPVATDTDKMLLKEFYPNAKGLYAFQSTMWKNMNFRKIMLTKIYRQNNVELVEKLHAIKYGNLDAVQWFNDNTSPFFMTDGVTICPTNKLVEQYNHDAWSMFSDCYMEEYCPTIISGTLSEIPQSHQSLQLAVGMRIMTTSNGKTYKNGSMGTVTKLNKKSIRVKLDNGNVVTVTPQRMELENGVIYKQLPIVLGYAITANKSEGMTFDSINVVPGYFAPGQLYTALSRAKTITRIHIVGELTAKDLIVDIDALRMTVDS